MGIFGGLIGNAGEVSAAESRELFGEILGDSESVELAYKLIRDHILLTNRRVLLIDKQGITGRKVEYRSIPYRSITNFAVESAGTLDLDADLKIWISGLHEPIVKKFSKGTNVHKLQALLAKNIAG